MRTKRQHHLDRETVRALLQMCGIPLAEDILLDVAARKVAPTARISEGEDSLRFLEREGRIVAVQTDTGAAWTITPAGRAWAAVEQIT